MNGLAGLAADLVARPDASISLAYTIAVVVLWALIPSGVLAGVVGRARQQYHRDGWGAIPVAPAVAESPSDAPAPDEGEDPGFTEPDPEPAVPIGGDPRPLVDVYFREAFADLNDSAAVAGLFDRPTQAPGGDTETATQAEPEALGTPSEVLDHLGEINAALRANHPTVVLPVVTQP